MKMLRVWMLLVVMLAACGDGGPGSISGQVGFFSGGAGAIQVSQKPFAQTSETDFVPGEVIVKFRPGVSLQTVGSLQVAGVELQRVEDLDTQGMALFRGVAGKPQTLEVVQALSRRADVLYAQPNYIRQAFKTPNDTFYNFQWHYPAINLPAAWDIEDGTSRVVTVAVIDSGIVGAHPDIPQPILGYDFISNPQIANDGNGRDNDPEDTGNVAPGVPPEALTGYHGTHVAGTVAAATNNNRGVAGVSWGARLLHIRALGVGGGSDADIIAALRWAVGLPVSGVPNNANPAAVVNMSLGGRGTCAPAWQDTINQASNQPQRPIIVVAAGNSAENASDFTPASCSGVITVGATETRGFRAYYSNYGPRIDVMAPGGDITIDRNADGYADGVLSPLKDDNATGANQFIYQFYQGTSMAAPHVAGLVALMKARRSELTYSEALDILKRTAVPLSGASCTGRPSDAIPADFPTLSSSDCGAGLVNAQAAVSAAGSATPSYTLLLNPTSATLSPTPGSSVDINVSIARIAGFSNAVNLSLSGLPVGINGQFNPSSVTGGTSTLRLQVSGSPTPGTYNLTINGSSGSINRSVGLALTVGTPAPPPSVQGTVVFALYVAGNDIDPNKSAFVTIAQTGQTAPYRIENLAGGDYVVIAWKDLDGDQDITPGDYLGGYTNADGDLLLVRPTASNVRVPLSVVQGTQNLKLPGPEGISLLPSLRQLYRR
ncbi:S8 family peptidase [Meiothermus taiwanensis]|jgi:serine protease|uniref:Extracellular basic protease n=2 Tax=Meiothermus taiwanensis TaxID=172827 RepID=A0A399DRL7_9DEIN|nr:S8 family peptidase [Meiothermus taiwanensis]AWR87447.1 peptidase S8 and S53 subtilisin kexin sedolisin [Meiothermus taiwanensis WR-220]KIQ55915.1 peptidase S8 [Meiothermus taiwanensis]KZK17114.1 peptidase S8 [Meiothermus taiwanensis]RIH74944.1 Extracellular basic protease [Meiothermus taiwanensis]